MKSTYTFVFILISYLSFAQTSISTEISIKTNPHDYYRIQGNPKKITVKEVNNPNDALRFEQKIEYTFNDDFNVRKTLYRDGELTITESFVLDSLKRRIEIESNYKHKAIGWEKKRSRIIYRENSKEMHFLNASGSVFKKMIVDFDSIGSPIKITSLRKGDVYDGSSTAEYDYGNSTYVYSVFQANGNLVTRTVKNYNKDYIITKDDKGNPTKMHGVTARKEANVIHEVKYKYDKQGNWIKRTKKLIMPEKRKVLSVVTRKIKYR